MSVEADVVLIQTAIGDYRQAVIDILVERLGPRFIVFTGPSYFDPSLKTRIRMDPALHLLGNHFLAHRRLLWQHGSIHAGWEASVAILEYNPRILSGWALLLGRRLRSKRTLLWGHAWSRSGPNARSEPARRVMRWLSSGIIVYSSAQAQQLAAVMTARHIFVAPNAMYRANDMRPVEGGAGPADSFVYVGRLVRDKRPDLLVRGFRMARPYLPHGTRLVIVGDGPLRSELEAEAADLGSSVAFVGHAGDLPTLRTIYSSAIASVSPGPAGLSITQSLGFGVPMIVADNALHGPEISAIAAGWNALFFLKEDARDLARVMIQVASERAFWATRSDEIAAQCRSAYSAESMANGILEATGLTR